MTKILPGAIHIHTTYSDGNANVEEVIKEAQKAGLKWIIITDHNTMGAKSYEGIYDDLIVIVGDEISPDKGNHYLALDIKEEITQNQPPQDYVNEVREQGGFGFVAHPDEKIQRNNPWPALRWDDWSMKDFGGLEIWNYMSDWVDWMNMKNPLPSLLLKNHTLKGPSKEVLEWWDKLSEESEEFIPAIGGADVHAFPLAKAPIVNKIKIFPYKDLFEAVINLLLIDEELSGDFESAKKQILSALKNAQNIVINRAWCKKNPEFSISNGEESRHAGQKIALSADMKLNVKLPKKGNIRVIHNGKMISECNQKEYTSTSVEKGLYRVEVYLNKKPWIFTNNIKVC